MPYRKSNSGGRFAPSFDSSNIARQIQGMAAKDTKKVLASLADDIEREIDSGMEQKLVTDRDPKRRKKGTKHAKGSVTVTVDGESFPFEVSVLSIANSAKMASLEYGSRPHQIKATNAPLLVFPRTEARSGFFDSGSFVRTESGRRPTRRARSGASPRGERGSGGKIVKAPEVWHPGNRPYGFIRDAIEKVLGQRFG